MTDPKRLGKTVEGRARVQPCRKSPGRLTALAAEVRFSRPIGQIARVFFFKLPQNRHRVTQRLGGAESKDLVGASFTHCCSELFGHRSPTTGYSMVTGTLGIDRAMRLIQVAGNANVKTACMAAVHVDVAADRPRGKTRWLKSSRAAGGKLSDAEVLRLRATSAVSPDKSVRRSAQDDDFVGV